MRPATIRFLFVSVFSCLFVLSAATARCAPSDTFDRTVPLNSGGSFDLQNVNGSVEVSGWDRNDVQIHAVKTAKRDARDLDRVNIEVDSRPDAVSVLTRYPEDEGVEVTVQYHIRVPHDALLRHVTTVNGGLHISGVSNAGEVRSVNGNVDISDSSGRIKARTTNGNLRIELRRFEAANSLSAETVNGSVVIAMPPDAGGKLDVLTMNGDFRSELPVTFEGSLGPREFHGILGRGGSPVRVRTVNGGVRVVAMRPTV